MRSGERKAVELLDEALARRRRHQRRPQRVRAPRRGPRPRGRRRVDAAVAGDDPGPLAGIPFGVKDLDDCAGMPTSHGLAVVQGRRAGRADGVDVARLRAAGAVPIGKTAAPEFGILNFARTKAWGVTRNPWDLERTPGGSSSGSAAAVAAGVVPFATASDGGGSIRIPASFCGLVGHKASFGRVAHPAAMTSQTTSVGVVTTTVAEGGRCLDVRPAPTTAIARHSAAGGPLRGSGRDARRRRPPGPLVARPRLRRARRPEVLELSEAAAEELAGAAGLELDHEPVEPARRHPGLDAVGRPGRLDPAADRGPLAGPGRGADAQHPRGFEAAESATAWIGRIHRRRFEFEAAVAELFAEVDVLLMPSTAVPAFAAEGPPPGGAMSTPFTMLANLCWNPATSVPAGLTSDGLPVGLQIVARRHRDDVASAWRRSSSRPAPGPAHPGPFSRLTHSRLLRGPRDRRHWSRRSSRPRR